MKNRKKFTNARLVTIITSHINDKNNEFLLSYSMTIRFIGYEIAAYFNYDINYEK